MTLTRDNLILKFTADCYKVSIVACDTDEEVAIVLRMSLSITEYVRIKDVDLKCSTAVLAVAADV